MITTRIRDFATEPLRWEQPRSLRMDYELRTADRLIATLRFRSAFGSFATLQDGEGCWTFKRVGFWHPQVTIRALESDQEVAIFRNNTWTHGGTLAFADGRCYLASTNFWTTEYHFKTMTAEPLVAFRKIGGLLHLSSQVEILPAAAQLPELPWLVGFGWYLTILMHADASTAASATVVT